MNTWMKRCGRLLGAWMVVAGVVACAGCSGPSLSSQGADVNLEAHLPAAQPPQGLSFSVIKTSESNGAHEALIVSGGSWLHKRHPVQVAVLVKHPQGTFLFDTGLGRQVDQQFAVNTWLDKQFFGYGPVIPAADQLDKAGWPASSIQMIVPSHMHWDHISALPDFPEATVWVSGTEREHALQGHAPGFLQSQFAGVQRWHDLVFNQAPYLGFPASLDLFGDGAVVLVPLGGHTAGQVGMFLNLPSGRRYFFTGDVTWTIEGLRWAADRSWLLRQVIHVDDDEARNLHVIAHIHQIMQRFPDLIVVPAHDENVFKTLPHFPQLQG